MKPIFAACLLLHITALIQAQVGIGTPTPSSKLEVIGAGTTSATTALKVGSASSTILTVRNDGNVGIGTSSHHASAQLDLSSTTKGFLPPRMTTTERSAISATGAASGLVVYNTTINQLEYYNGTTWTALAAGNSPIYAQFSGSAGQTFTIAGDKMNFPTTIVNVGGISINSSNKITLPAGRIFRIDLNLGWAQFSTSSYCRFAVYNNSSDLRISPTAHLEAVSATNAFAGSGTVTTFIDTNSGSISIDVRYVAGTSVAINDANNGQSFATITIQTVD